MLVRSGRGCDKVFFRHAGRDAGHKAMPQPGKFKVSVRIPDEIGQLGGTACPSQRQGRMHADAHGGRCQLAHETGSQGVVRRP